MDLFDLDLWLVDQARLEEHCTTKLIRNRSDISQGRSPSILPSSSMARTKQTARTSTGGRAPRIPLQEASTSLEAAPPATAVIPVSRSVQRSEEVDQHEDVRPFEPSFSFTDLIISTASCV